MKAFVKTGIFVILAVFLFSSASCQFRNTKEEIPHDPDIRSGRPDIYPAPLNYLGEQKWGYINNTGRFILKPEFDKAFRFQPNGLAVAGKEGKVGLIDTAGKFVVELVYDAINDFTEGLAVAQDDSGFKVLNENGEVISGTYPYIDDYSNGRASFYTILQDGKLRYGYLDETGNVAVRPVFEYAGSFENGRAVVRVRDSEYAIIDRNGNILKQLKYSYVMNLSDGMAAFLPKQDGKYGYLNSKGDIAIAPSFLSVMGFREGTAVVNASDDYTVNKYGLIDKKGNYLIKPQYNDILQLGEGMVALGIAADPDNIFAGSKYALAGQDGKIITDFLFYGMEHFKSGIASVYDNTKTFFIDKSGKKVDSLPSAEGIGTLEVIGDLIYADIDRRPYYMNLQGEIIYRPSNSIFLKNGIKVSEEKFRPNRNYLVYYPVLSNMKNLSIEQSVNSRLKDLWTDSSVKPSDNLDYNYEGSFAVGFNRKNLLVLEESGYDYPFGAAHGMPVMEYVHLDTETGVFYNLEDLFKDGSNYVEVLSSIVEEQIKLHGEEMGVWPDSYKGIRPDQPFYITEDSLALYFYPYEIAPYAAGFPTFKIPFEEISEIINKKGSFWQSFN